MRIDYADRVVSCSYHAYGTGAKRFLNAHPCEHGHRIIGIVEVGGRRAVLSTITVTFGPQGDDSDGSATAQDFGDVENEPGTGGMNDHLREGNYIVGVAHRIPFTEAFTVITDGPNVEIFDAWWVRGTTEDQDPTLVSLEEAVAGTSITPTD